MRFGRIAAIGLAVLVLILGASAALILHNQAKIVSAVLASVKARSGIEITASASHVLLHNHLVVVLDQPHVATDGGELVKLQSLRVVISYHSILFNKGLPLYALILEHPEVTLPVAVDQTKMIAVPKPDSESVKGMLEALDALARIAWRVDAVEGSVRWADGSAGAEHIGLLAFRQRRSPRLWRIAFDATVSRAPFVGTRLAGRMRVGGGRTRPHEVGVGRLWFWNTPVAGPLAEGLQASAMTQGTLNFALADDGSTTGRGDFGAKNVQLKGARITQPIVLGDFSLNTEFAISEGGYALRKLTLSNVGKPVLSGDSEITQPYGAKPKVGFHVVGNLEIDAARLKARMLELRGLPERLVATMKQITAGRMRVDVVSFSGALEEVKIAPLATIEKNLEISADLQGAGFSLPEDLKLPPVTELSGQLSYSKGTLQLTQGGAQLGKSTIDHLSLRTNFNGGIEDAPYQVALGARADLAELQPAIAGVLDSLQVPNRDRLTALDGRIDFEAQASGKLRRTSFEIPPDYVVKVDLEHTKVTLKGAPGPVELTRGGLVVEPGIMRLDDIAVVATGGNGRVNGEISTGPHRTIRGLKIELHQMPAGPWLGLVLNANDLMVQGPIGGDVTIDSDPARPGDVLLDGKLTLVKGEVALGFLRTSILAQGATLTMRRHQIILNMPGSELEGQPLDFRLEVADIGHPSLRIDAVSQKMDLEVMKFVQLPWTKNGPATFFKEPVHGHVEIRNGNLDKLGMSNVRTDFTYNAGDWRIYNCTARSLKGIIGIEVTGRAPDHWIHMKGTAADVDASEVFTMSGSLKRSPLLGQLSLAYDLWGDSGINFFDTLAGRVAITVRKGNLDKFTLLSRLLSFIDLKNWLTAKIPDPRVAGIPFDSLIADFKGEHGLFYTDDLTLKGPVMDIVAAGSIKVGDAYLDMQVGMFPFNTANWLITNIPLIGERVASSKLVAAYFQVSGPIGDASITPKPITSVVEFFKRTLGMPINIIRPNTIK
ncbi:MAG TPA: AsmA-like C-terminal domain-containing protein [Candidatus Binataceae bacterium]